MPWLYQLMWATTFLHCHLQEVHNVLITSWMVAVRWWISQSTWTSHLDRAKLSGALFQHSEATGRTIGKKITDWGRWLLSTKSWENNHWTSVMSHLPFSKNYRVMVCILKKWISHETFCDTICKVRNWNGRTRRQFLQTKSTFVIVYTERGQ